MRNELCEVVEHFLKQIDPVEFMGHMSAGTVAWFTKNHSLDKCDMEAMEVYHFHMQQFFQELGRIKNSEEWQRAGH